MTPSADGRTLTLAVEASVASPAPSWSPSPQWVNVAAFQALAKQETSTWPRSSLGKLWKTGLVISSADDLTLVGGRGFPSQEVEEAFGNGNLVFTGPPPSGAPPAVIKWTNGAASTKVPVLSEAQTFNALKNNTVGRCPACNTNPLAVTIAQPDTMEWGGLVAEVGDVVVVGGWIHNPHPAKDCSGAATSSKANTSRSGSPRPSAIE